MKTQVLLHEYGEIVLKRKRSINSTNYFIIYMALINYGLLSLITYIK